MTTRLSPFATRLKAALADGYVPLAVLETELFHPNSHRNAVQGGPPGCRWTLVRELKRHKVPISSGRCTAASLVGPWPGTKVSVEGISKARRGGSAWWRYKE